MIKKCNKCKKKKNIEWYKKTCLKCEQEELIKELNIQLTIIDKMNRGI